MRSRYSNIDLPSYDEFLEKLKIEFSGFLRYAESGKTIRYQGLKARKKSMRLRDLLKLFRPVSIEQEKKINNILQKAKDTIKGM